MKKQSGLKILLIAALLLLLALAVMAGIYLINTRSKGTDYREEITAAQKYLNEGDYRAAIASYQRAIQKNPKEETAYIGLAEVYEQQGDLAAAVTILQDGYRATGSKRLYALLNSKKSDQEETENESPEETVSVLGEEPKKVLNESANISWNMGNLEKFEAYNYGDYTREFGEGTITQEDGFLVVTHSLAGVACYYRNTAEHPTLVDEVKGIPDTAAMPEKIRVTNLEILFDQFEGKISKSRLEQMISIVTEVEEQDGHSVIEFTYDECVFTIETDEEGNIVGSDSWNEIVLLNANKNVKGDTGFFSGSVVDVLNQPIVGVPVEFVNLTDRSAEKVSVVSGSGGAFETELVPGNYEIHVQASKADSKYIDETYTQLITKDSNIIDFQAIIGIRSEGIIRIVLDWGAFPQDLDAHLTGTCNGQTVQVDYTHPRCSGDGFQANLDVDDTNGYGPETITFEGDLANADLTYEVVDFEMTGTMLGSDARVRIYMPDGTVTEQRVPSPDTYYNHVHMNYWTVFTIKNGKLEVSQDMLCGH